jgi:hypothetical protein
VVVADVALSEPLDWRPRAGAAPEGPDREVSVLPRSRIHLDDGLCFIATDGHFAIDTIERAQERGPEA